VSSIYLDVLTEIRAIFAIGPNSDLRGFSCELLQVVQGVEKKFVSRGRSDPVHPTVLLDGKGY